MTKRYAISIHWSNEDAGFIATCGDFPGVSAFGATYAESAAEMDIALDAAIEAYRALGRDLPEPAFDSALRAATHAAPVVDAVPV